MTDVGSVQDYGQREEWPEHVVYVGMPGDAARGYGILDSLAGPFGKPWSLRDDPRGWPAAYVEYLARKLLRNPSFRARVAALAGKTLLCWCTAKQRERGVEVKCHARILAEFVEMLRVADIDPAVPQA